MNKSKGGVPPLAKKIQHIIKKYGQLLRDDYAWLRKRGNLEVLNYLKRENRYADSILKSSRPLRHRLYREILSRIKESDSSVPAKDGRYFYYSRTAKGKQYPILCRKLLSLDAPEQILLDLNILAQGSAFFQLGVFEVSPNGRLLAYSVDRTGDEAHTVYVKDLLSGKLMSELIKNTGLSLEWSRDSSSIFYTLLDKAQRPYKVMRHELGRSTQQDQEMYGERNRAFSVSLYKTKDRNYIILDTSSTISSELYYLKSTNAWGEFRLIEKRKKKLEYSLEHYEGKFFIVTNDHAKNFKLVQTSVDKPQGRNWKTVIKHRKNVKIEDVDVCRNHLIVYERLEGLLKVRVIHLPSGKSHYVPFEDSVYSVDEEGNHEFESKTLRLSYSTLIQPKTIFDYELEQRTKKIQKIQEVGGGFKSSRYVTERIYARSQDGVLIPISLAYRKGIRRDGTNPFYLYGYGSYGHSIEPSFASSRLSLLDRGFIYGIAHVRGGGEYGERWHEQGKLLKKRNTFLDFMACARHLVAKKYTRPQNLIISGGSAGGMLIGASLNVAPQLFGGALMHVPFVDVLNTMLDPALPLTVTEYDEWGDPRKKRFFRIIKGYSPYDNIKRQAYPPIFVTGCYFDARVQFWEPAKWVAKLRELKTDKNLLLLRTNFQEGHTGASGRYDVLKELALDYAFIFLVLGIKR
ncbi:MAG TPA: S9 family peptidase [Candidatus Omnitrophota bacterium]|nr:S9 family peptidase [Candidatus Omnitrophota bacterium]